MSLASPTPGPFEAAEPVSLEQPFNPSVEDLLSLVGDGVISTDEQGRIILFNKAAQEMFGFTSTEVINQPIEFLLPDRFHIFHRQEVRGFGQSTSDKPRVMGAKREVLGRRSNGSEFSVEATLCRHVVNKRSILTVAVRDVTERKLHEELRRVLASELSHRMKNTMAVINSVVSLSARTSSTIEAFEGSIQRRLLAVERSNEVLFAENPISADLRDLLDAELAAFLEPSKKNVFLQGPSVNVPARLSVSLSLIFHELATNSLKYGALSQSGGHVTVKWSVQNDAERQRLTLDWNEIGGPLVKRPESTGLGTELIEKTLCEAIRGKLHVNYAPTGLEWRLQVSLL